MSDRKEQRANEEASDPTLAPPQAEAHATVYAYAGKRRFRYATTSLCFLLFLAVLAWLGASASSLLVLLGLGVISVALLALEDYRLPREYRLGEGRLTVVWASRTETSDASRITLRRTLGDLQLWGRLHLSDDRSLNVRVTPHLDGYDEFVLRLIGSGAKMDTSVRPLIDELRRRA